jgi:hypothetical protein
MCEECLPLSHFYHNKRTREWQGDTVVQAGSVVMSFRFFCCCCCYFIWVSNWREICAPTHAHTQGKPNRNENAVDEGYIGVHTPTHTPTGRLHVAYERRKEKR